MRGSLTAIKTRAPQLGGVNKNMECYLPEITHVFYINKLIFDLLTHEKGFKTDKPVLPYNLLQVQTNKT